MNRLLIVLSLIILIGCGDEDKDSREHVNAAQDTLPKSSENLVYLSDAQIKNATIEIGHPEARMMQTVLKVNGLVDVPPQNKVTISFPSGGYVKSTTILPGMKVRKGQILAVMQDQSFVQMQEDYLMAQSKVGFLQKEYDRQKLLNQTKATSDKMYEQTASDYQQARISMKATEQKLRLIGINPSSLSENSIKRTVNVYAPINGFVSDVKINFGKYVNPSDVLFELVNINDLHLALTVFEKDLPSIHPGQLVTAYLTSNTSKTYNAKVLLVSRTLDDNRSAVIHCHFVGALPSLLPGMFVNADIQITNNSSVVVPESAVVRSGDLDYIFIEQKPKQFELTLVKTTASQDGFIAINSAISDLLSKVIIKKNAYAAFMKMKNTLEED